MFSLPLLVGLFWSVPMLGVLVAAIVQAYRASCACPEWKGRIWVFGLLGSVSFCAFFGAIAFPAIFPQGPSWNRGPLICGSALVGILSFPIYSYYVLEALYDFNLWWWR